MILSGCSGALDQKSQGDSSVSPSIELKFPAGYVYDPATSRLFFAGSQKSRVDTSQIVYIQLIVSGPDMDTFFADVPLDTLHAAVPVTYGERRFNVTVQLDNGDTLTGSKTVQVSPSGPSAIELEVQLNDLPVLSLSISSSSPGVNEPVTIKAIAYDPEGNELGYSWNASGGILSVQGASVTWASDVEGTFDVCVTVSDDEGGTAYDCAFINVGGGFGGGGGSTGGGLTITDISADNYHPNVGDTVFLFCQADFNDSAMATGTINYSWFGPGGEIGTTQSVAYSVTSTDETVLDCFADSGTDAVSAYIKLNSSGNSPPDVNANVSNSHPATGETVGFDCFVSDPDGDIPNVWWEDPFNNIIYGTHLDYVVQDDTVAETFTCFADDLNGGVSSFSISINGDGGGGGGGGGAGGSSVAIVTVDASNYSPFKDEMVYLSCNFDAVDPQSVTVSWTASDGYANSGQYVDYLALDYDVYITCRVDDFNTGDFDEVTIFISPQAGGGGGNPPTIDSFWADDYYPPEGGTIYFECNASDLDADLVLVEVIISDGSYYSSAGPITAGDFYVPYDYSNITFECMVEDANGGKMLSSFDIYPQTVNLSPWINYVDAYPVNPTYIGENVDHDCDATDPEGDALSYDWEIDGAFYVSGKTFSRTWDGVSYTATCTVDDGFGNVAYGSVYVTP